MKQNFTVQQGALEGVEAFLSVAQHRSFRKAAAPLKAGRLVQVLAPFAASAPGLFLYYPGHRQIRPKLRAFVDHVKSRARATRPVRAKKA